MTETAAHEPRISRWKIFLGVLVLLTGGAFLAVHVLLDPERVSAYLLERAGKQLGLELSVSEPAGIGLLPHLAIELYGLSARAPNGQDLVFSANFVEIVLPWSSLRSEQVEVSSLRLDQPILNLPALQRWQASQATTQVGPPAALGLPSFDTPLRLRDGRVVGEDWRLVAINASASPLRESQPFSLELAARLERGESNLPMALRLDTTITSTPQGLDLGELQLRASQPELDFSGRALLAPPQRFELSGRFGFTQWPATVPQLLPDDGSDTGFALVLDAGFDPQGRGETRFDLRRGEEALTGTLQTGDLLDWLADPAGRALPPLRGDLEARRLALEGIELKGVRVRIEAREDEAAADTE